MWTKLKLTLNCNWNYHYSNFLDGWFYLFDFVLDSQFDAAEAGSVVGPWLALVYVTVQYGLHFLRVPTKVQHTHHKVLTLHGQLAVFILQELWMGSLVGKRREAWIKGEQQTRVRGRVGLYLEMVLWRLSTWPVLNHNSQPNRLNTTVLCVFVYLDNSWWKPCCILFMKIFFGIWQMCISWME